MSPIVMNIVHNVANQGPPGEAHLRIGSRSTGTPVVDEACRSESRRSAPHLPVKVHHTIVHCRGETL